MEHPEKLPDTDKAGHRLAKIDGIIDGDLLILPDAKYLQLARDLNGMGAHLLKTGRMARGAWDSKVPVDKDWQKRMPPFSSIEEHLTASTLARPTHIGILPASLGVVIVDIDKGGNDAAVAVGKAVGRPVFRYATSREEDGTPHWHFAYPCGDMEYGCVAIYHPLDGQRIGELRSANGQIRLPRQCGALHWTANLTERGGLKGVKAVDLSPILVKGPGGGNGKSAAAPTLNFEEGERNNSLNTEVFKAAAKGDKEAAQAAVQAARKSGLHHDEIRSTFASAWSAGSAAGVKNRARTQSRRSKRASTLAERAADGVFRNYLPLAWTEAVSGAERLITALIHVGGWMPRPDRERRKEILEAKRNEQEPKQADSEWEAAHIAKIKGDAKARWAYAADCLSTVHASAADDLEGILRTLGVHIRLNVRRDVIEYSLTPDDQFSWSILTDTSECAVQDFISSNFKVETQSPNAKKPFWPYPTSTKSTWVQAMNAIVENKQIDDFKVWLESLPEWDGVKRIPTLLMHMYGCGETDSFAAWAAKYIFVGAVQRTFDPGSKLDEIPVMIGKQGIGKSALTRQALPPKGQTRWFSDSLNLSGTAKDQMEALQGRVICESAELTGARRADLEHLKTFITRQDDGAIRGAYDRRTKPRPRRMVLIGTADRRDCLPPDTAGSRRFVPIVLPQGCHVEAWMDDGREQLWAEAVERYENGERGNLPRELKMAQEVSVKQFIAIDQKLDDRLGELEETGAIGSNAETMKSISDLVNRRETEPGEVDEMTGKAGREREVKPAYRYTDLQVAAALKIRGWCKTKRFMHHGLQAVRWLPPEHDGPETAHITDL